MVKIVNEELVALMGGSEAARLNVKNKGQTIIMLCGLQGNGKTTHAAKLAKYFIKQGRRPMPVSYTHLDVYKRQVLKVIIETCLLTDEEKEKMCDIVCEAGADYIKTSTGFSTAGANFHDVELMVKGVHGRCKVKAAGGISTVEDMETFLALGADRLGTSRAVKILNGEQAKGY